MMQRHRRRLVVCRCSHQGGRDLGWLGVAGEEKRCRQQYFVTKSLCAAIEVFGGMVWGWLWPRDNYEIKQPLQVSTATVKRLPH